MATCAADLHREGTFGFSAEPFDDESLPGFIMRFACRLRFGSADRLAAMAGLRQPGSTVSMAGLARLAEMTGSSPRRLERVAYWPTERFAHHAFLGSAVHRELIDISHRRLCPRCVEHVPYHRACWDLSLVTSCPEHSIRLVAVCPNQRCGRRMAWRRPNLGRCVCGLDFTSLSGSRVLAGEVDACARLLGLIRGLPLPWLPETLAGCDRSDLARLGMCIGMFVTEWAGERRIETLVNSGADAVAGVMVAGMEALADWPATLHGYLRGARVTEGGRRGRYGARKALGAFYGWLGLMESGGVKSAVTAATRDFVDLDPELSRRVHRSRLLARPGASRLVIGLNEAAAILGVSGDGVKALMASGTLPEVTSEGRGVPMSLPRGAVDELARQAALSLTLKSAAALLGISRSRVRRLVDAGVLTAQSPSKKAGASNWSLCRKEVTALLGSGKARRHGNRGSREQLVTFEHAAEVLRRGGVDFSGFVRMIVDGRLRVVGVDAAARGLKRLRFDGAQLRSERQALATDPVLSVQAAAELLGLKWQVVRHLVDIGIVAANDCGVTTGEMERFRTEYVSGAVLARQRKTSPRHLASVLAKLAILPVTGPGVDGGRQNFFRRSDLGDSFGFRGSEKP